MKTKDYNAAESRLKAFCRAVKSRIFHGKVLEDINELSHDEHFKRLSPKYQAMVRADKRHDKMMQEFEDNRVKMAIESIAQEQFTEWMSSPQHDLGMDKLVRVFIWNPRMSLIGCYHVHDPGTAKYIDSITSIHDKIKERFNELKTEYEASV